jgi:NDP-sugar pyrophosphorylase family protein/tRNA A-37 threonylcarbamoyl transferase component Bud32
MVEERTQRFQKKYQKKVPDLLVEKINAFIPSAGLGERLRPITDDIPKPLLPVLGRPAIDRVIDKVLSLPVGHIGVNMHHKWDKLVSWAEGSGRIQHLRLFREDPIMGTGGALKNAASFLGKRTFIVHNSDIISDINLITLLEKHLSSRNIVTLAVHDNKKFNNVWIDGKGHVMAVGKRKHESVPMLCKIAFAGIAVYSPEFIDFLPEGPSSVVDSWLRAISAGYPVGTLDFSGCYWNDIGSPEGYASAVFRELREHGETIYIHPSTRCSGHDIHGYVVLEKGSHTAGRSVLKNCIVLEGAHIEQGSVIQNSIVGPKYQIPLELSTLFPSRRISSTLLSSPFLGADSFAQIRLAGTGGSDRLYYRVAMNDKSAILMICQRDNHEFTRHITYTHFFRKHGLPVPDLFSVDAKNSQALFEDLGDLNLYSWLKCINDSERIEDMYRRVLDILIKLHTAVTENITACPLLLERKFDYEHLRWETNYFLERFVREIQGIAVRKKASLEEELRALAGKVDAFRKTVVHRDFQSQNIMIAQGNIPRLIDYQGARIGPPAYDISSILWDPYHQLPDYLRENLLDYYCSEMKNLAVSFSESEFRSAILPCRLQRHMQALGAYGFLANEKGKKFFLKFVPRALGYLKQEIALADDEYPVLHELIMKLT